MADQLVTELEAHVLRTDDLFAQLDSSGMIATIGLINSLPLYRSQLRRSLYLRAERPAIGAISSTSSDKHHPYIPRLST